MATVNIILLALLLAVAATLLIVVMRRPALPDLARDLLAQADAQRAQELQRILDHLRATFGELSQQALSRSNEQFLQLAETRLAAQTKQADTALEGRQKLIDETVKQIATRLTEVGHSLQTLEKDRRESQGALLQRLDGTAKATIELQNTTARLREALAHPQRRGQWGERMAEDVLRLAGFIEGVNYEKQAATESGSRPDFTFPLPQGRRVNMDVKFPLANYLKCLDAADDAGAEQAKAAFLRDVRTRIREVTTRAYIDPDSGTVDYVLVFIPNEQVYGFIHQHDPAVLDDALQQKVVLCSPLTLYAFLAVVRQAAENLRVEQAAHEILGLLGAFNKEWGKYVELMDKVGKSLEQALDNYRVLVTTRTKKLDRRLEQVEALRSARRIELPADSSPEV